MKNITECPINKVLYYIGYDRYVFVKQIIVPKQQNHCFAHFTPLNYDSCNTREVHYMPFGSMDNLLQCFISEQKCSYTIL